MSDYIKSLEKRITRLENLVIINIIISAGIAGEKVLTLLNLI